MTSEDGESSCTAIFANSRYRGHIVYFHLSCGLVPMKLEYQGIPALMIIFNLPLNNYRLKKIIDVHFKNIASKF